MLSKKTIFLMCLIVMNAILGILYLQDPAAVVRKKYPELAAASNLSANFGEVQEYFEKLADDKGARYALEVLKVAPIPPGIDMHLLGHVVGDKLYEQEGVEGISVCTDDFRNACSHAIVIGLFDDQGEAALPEIAQACRRAPGGSGAYTMCFHGLGHGILAFLGYSMEKATVLCAKIGTAAYGYREEAECVSGTVMEIIGGGFHDREIWSTQRQKYLRQETPLALCDSTFIPRNARSNCLTYLTPLLFQNVGADLARPTAEDFRKAFLLCDTLVVSDIEGRSACFGGFGKEFTVLIRDRDIRKESLNSITDDQLKTVHAWCALADNLEGIEACTEAALNSLYWGGENDRAVSIRFCNLASNVNSEKVCFDNLTKAVKYYISDQSYKESFCNELPETYHKECSNILNLKLR